MSKETMSVQEMAPRWASRCRKPTSWSRRTDSPPSGRHEDIDPRGGVPRVAGHHVEQEAMRKGTEQGKEVKATPDLNEFVFWRADCMQDPKNCSYPHRVVVTDAEGFDAMARYDHVSATYENSYRSNGTFEASTVQSGDVDN